MSNEVILESLIEEAVKQMSTSMKKNISSTKWRKEQLRKYGTEVFLDPVAMKFPVKYNGKYDCRMIHAAAIHATMYSKKGSSVNGPKYYQDISSKAKEVYANNECKGDIKAKLQENDEVELSLIDILEIYDLSE